MRPDPSFAVVRLNFETPADSDVTFVSIPNEHAMFAAMAASGAVALLVSCVAGAGKKKVS
jgi:protein tyrosine phosphatase